MRTHLVTVVSLVVGLSSASAAAAPPIEVHGHRGARAVLPENTLPAFEHALAVGVDYLELDTVVTADNRVVVMHDLLVPSDRCVSGDGRRLTEAPAVRTLMLAELKKYDCGTLPNPRFPAQQPIPGARIPTLDEVLALVSAGPAPNPDGPGSGSAVHSSVQLNIETKILPGRPEWTPTPERFARLVVAVIRRHGLERRTVIQSFDQRTLQVVARIAPEIRRSLLVAGNLIDHVAAAKAARASIVSPAQHWITLPAVRRIHDAGLQVVPWTANTPEHWRRLVDMGVDGIITDDPAALLDWLRAQGRHR